MWHKLGLALVAALALLGGACGGSGGSDEVVLVTHDAFVMSKQLQAAFEQESGLKLTILQGGDAGEMLNRALLTKGNPQGDAIFGIDNNLLSRAVGVDLLEPYEAKDLGAVEGPYRLDPTNELTPVDHADVCLNVDKRWFAARGIDPPASLDDLVDPAYRKLLVVENPATSTPGLAFMLATIARFGENGWREYWRQLRRERHARGRRLERGVHGPVLGSRRRQGQAADRRLLCDEPPGRGDVREVTAEDGADRSRRVDVLPAGRARRRARRARRTRKAPAHWSISCCPRSSSELSPRATSCSRSARGRRCRTRSGATPRSRTSRSTCRPPRSDATATAGSTSGHGSFCAEPRLPASARSPCPRRS